MVVVVVIVVMEVVMCGVWLIESTDVRSCLEPIENPLSGRVAELVKLA